MLLESSEKGGTDQRSSVLRREDIDTFMGWCNLCNTFILSPTSRTLPAAAYLKTFHGRKNVVAAKCFRQSDRWLKLATR